MSSFWARNARVYRLLWLLLLLLIHVLALYALWEMSPTPGHLHIIYIVHFVQHRHRARRERSHYRFKKKWYIYYNIILLCNNIIIMLYTYIYTIYMYTRTVRRPALQSESKSFVLYYFFSTFLFGWRTVSLLLSCERVAYFLIYYFIRSVSYLL